MGSDGTNPPISGLGKVASGSHTSEEVSCGSKKLSSKLDLEEQQQLEAHYQSFFSSVFLFLSLSLLTLYFSPLCCVRCFYLTSHRGKVEKPIEEILN